MAIAASRLRENGFRVLDEVLATGEPVEIERNGRRLFIVADQPPSRLDRLVHRPDVVVGDPEEFVHLDWSGEWSESG
jgi:hypothetical protein